MGGQLVGIIALFAAGALVDPVTQSYQNALWMLSGVCVVGAVLSVVMLLLNPKYKRLEVEKRAEEEASFLDPTLN